MIIRPALKAHSGKWEATKVFDPGQLLIVLDHNAPPTNSKLANDYQQIRDFCERSGN